MRPSGWTIGVGLLIWGAGFGLAQAQTDGAAQPIPPHRPHVVRLDSSRHVRDAWTADSLSAPAPLVVYGELACVNVMCGNHVFIGLAN